MGSQDIQRNKIYFKRFKMNKDEKIYVAGHNGMVGSAIVRNLEAKGYTNIITINHNELDLTNQNLVNSFFNLVKPEYVFLAAAKVGGILANSKYPAEFIYKNLMIQTNVIHASYTHGVKKLMFLGSSCIYPKLAAQPIKEEYLLTGELECSNEAYAVAKIAGVRMCKHYNYQYGTNFLSVMPTNLYGENDNYDLETSHVMPALIRKVHEAKILNSPEINLWGTGIPKREFLHVDDAADACVYLMERCNSLDIGELINVGTGKDISLKDLLQMIKEVIRYRGITTYDISKPDGTPQKLLDISKLNRLGWKAKISLREGIKKTYNQYVKTL